MPANPATDVSRTRAKARDKSATRLAILDAARKLAEATGVDNLSLSAVATEANFARATVYGYFRSKEELIQSVIAENLAAVGRAMRGGGEWTETEQQAEEPSAEPAAEATSIESAEVVTLSGVDVGPDIDEETEIVIAEALEAENLQAETEVAQAEAEADPVEPTVVEAAPAVEEIQDASSVRREHLENILSKLAPNDPENSEGSAAAMARFDRRLRVFEKTLADVQAAQERTEKSGSTSSDTLAETLRGLNQRLEESERRQREIFAELRASTREAAWRLDKLDAAEKNAPVPEASQETAVSVHVPVLPEVVETKIDETAPVDEPKAGEVSAASVTYLAAARQSARAAMETQAVRKPRPWLFRIPRKYLMLACALMSVVTTLVLVLVVQRVSAIEAHAEEAPVKVASAHAPKLAMATALDELSAMASAGDTKAQLLVGMEYLHGVDGLQKNQVEAAKWIVRAAGRGLPMAQYWAGYVYQNGLGVSADPDEAMRWYEAAADQGNVKAMYNLGVGYAAGWNGAKDEPEAARWFARAARMGYLDAQFNLAVLYERGQGVPANISDAYRWYAIAASSGDKESKSRLEAIAAQMNPDDLQSAQRSAMAFTVTPTAAAANVLPSVELKRT